MDREKKECILRAAQRAFARFGFKKASVDEIARDAGVAKGTVYLACESKEDLFYQAVHAELRSWLGDVSRAIDPRRPADELLVEISRMSVESMLSRPLVRDLYTGVHATQLASWEQRLADLRALGQANVEEVLRLGIKQGRFRGDLDVEVTAGLLQDLQTVGLMGAGGATDGGLDGLARRWTAGVALVLDGLRVRGG